MTGLRDTQHSHGATLPGPRDPATVIRALCELPTLDRIQAVLEDPSLLDYVLAALVRVERERDALQAKFERHHGYLDAAEARATRYKDALERIADLDPALTDDGYERGNLSSYPDEIAAIIAAAVDEPPPSELGGGGAAAKGSAAGLPSSLSGGPLSKQVVTSGTPTDEPSCRNQRCGHPRGWHRRSEGACLECGCLAFEGREPGPLSKEPK